MVSTRQRLPAFSAALAARAAMVVIFDGFVLWLIAQLLNDGSYLLAAVFGLVILIVTTTFLLERLRAYRWLAVGLSLAVLFVLYPIFYTFYLSTTNTGYGHILTQQQAVASLEREQYVPEGGQQFAWTAFQSPEGEYLLWLQAPDGETRLVGPGETIPDVQPGTGGIGALDEDGIPASISGYQRLERRDVVVLLDTLSHIEFGTPPETIRITSFSAAATTQPRYRYDAEADTITDLETGDVYHPEGGAFVGEEGQEIRPGFYIDVGLDNFARFFSSAALRGPLVTIISWNFLYAFLSVLLSFALGLFIALLFDNLPGKKLIRTLLIIPYPIPALVSILIWRNLLNPDFGALVALQESLFGVRTNWLTDPTWTRVAILMINMWLSYPYFYIVSSGALQAIPTDMLDAAAVDGANAWQKFVRITLPLLLQIVSPLLVASFAFNFNNFNL
ncbi:MAG: ABC transporter permease subunit, partial [Anaerolineae bacterium]|nr:ABC transporter permease subunit [Anaerolineae bacterium]